MKSYLCFLDLKNLLILLIFSALSLQQLSNKSFAGYFEEVIAWSSECFQTKNLNACRTALRIADDFQLLASSNDKHRCQTSLLGLEANLIMIILNSSNRTKVYLKALDDVRRDCDQVMNY